ncbi:MAG: hypothetical protein JWQ71_4465 [Pedosphaera sp.]|nr:hypothetical protein [Pedosphaera sp.]
MAMIDRYLLELLMQGDNNTEQEAIESAIFDRVVPLTYNLEKDRAVIEQQKPHIITHFLQTHVRAVAQSPAPKAAKKSTRRRSSGETLMGKKKSVNRRASLHTHPHNKNV